MAPKSGVWVYFSEVKDNKTICTKCTQEFIWHKSTSAMMNHLKNKHNIIVPSARRTNLNKQPQLREMFATVSSSSSSNGQRTSPPSTRAKATATCPIFRAAVGLEPETDDNEELVDDPRPLPSSSSSTRTVCNLADNEPTTPKRPRFEPSVAPTLHHFFDRAASFREGGHRNAEIQNALLYMIAKDNMPLMTTERAGFRVFMKAVQPSYPLPSADVVTARLAEKYKCLKASMGEIFAAQTDLCLTTDLWSETMKMRSYLGVTVHFREGVDMKSVSIEARPMPQRKDIANLVTVLREICQEWKIDLKAVTTAVSDNGQNIVGALKQLFGPERHLSCFAHKLNLVVSNSIVDETRRRQEDAEDPLPLPEDGEESGDDEDSDDDVGEVPQCRLHSSDPDEYIPSLLLLLKKVGRIVTFFKRSEVASELLRTLQKEKNPSLSDAQCLSLIQKVKTRWNSIYFMLVRFAKLSNLVAAALRAVAQRPGSTKRPPPPMLSVEEEQVLDEVRAILGPLATMTTLLSGDKYVCISQCIPLLNILRESLEHTLAVTPVGYNFKIAVEKQLDTRFSGIERTKQYAISTLLDPRFMKLHFKDRLSVSEAFQLIVEEMARGKVRREEEAVALSGDVSEEATTQSPSGSRDLMDPDADSDPWAIHRELLRKCPAPRRENPNDFTVELQQFLSRSHAPLESDPLVVWQGLRPVYPNLYPVAMKYLAVPPTSVPSERLFSKAGQIVTKRRNRLSGNRVNQLLFLGSLEPRFWFE